MPNEILPQAFYTRDTLRVARELLGQELCRGEVILRITEVEAYCRDDSANHCHRGPTARNAAMWDAGGHTYVYLCYGLHQMLNIVTGPAGSGEAVLIRSGEPLAGIETIEARRPGQKGPALLSGPGKVGAALAIDQNLNRHPLYRAGGLYLRRGTPPGALLCGPRIGIGYAAPEDQSAPWRFAIADTHWVSHRKALRPLTVATPTII